MKFCPQCGTTFEPEARFCLECGFDKSSFEQISDAVNLSPGIYVTEADITEPAKVSDLQPEKEPSCPQCGTTLSSGDRFCLECGFDTSASMDVETETPQAIQPTEIEETSIESSPVAETVLTPHGNKKFCSQCGSIFENDERFCPECGFDTVSGETVSNIKPEPVIIPPVVVKQPYQKHEILPPMPEPVRTTAPAYNQTRKPVEPSPQRKEKIAWLRIILIIIGVGVAGTAIWYGYNKYFVNSESTAGDANSKPMSLMDQELAKYKTAQQNQGTQQTAIDHEVAESATVEKKEIPSTVIPEVAESAIVEKKEIPSTVILEVGHKEEPKSKNPKNPTKLMISKPTMVTRITTDHYNDGMGTSRGGIITINDRSGMVFGSYKALGKKGKNGTPGARWVVEPNRMFPKGTYFIQDSDPATWSKNFVGTGFVIVEGYEVK